METTKDTSKKALAPKDAVKAAFEYLKSVTPESEKYSNFRVEEITRDSDNNYVLTLGYDIIGEFGFDRKREFKEFRVTNEGTVESMTIKRV